MWKRTERGRRRRRSASLWKNCCGIFRTRAGEMCIRDSIYKALQVDLNRSEDYCRRVEQRFLRQVNEQKPQSLDRFKSIWYNGRDGSNVHYHASRRCV